MRLIEYRRWGPLASPVSVEFPADLLLDLGWGESSGLLYGWKRGREIRVASLAQDEEQEKVGAFFSRIRGEVFLTEADLEFLNQHRADLALVVAGRRAGFFVREENGSIQTVRSHEEFSLDAPAEAQADPSPAPMPAEPAADAATAGGFKLLRLNWRRKPLKWSTARLWRVVLLAGLPLVAVAALAVHPQRAAQPQQSLTLHEAGNQLQITWAPERSAVLMIDDGGSRVAVPVMADQSTATYAMRGPDVEVSLLSADEKNHTRRVSARWVRKQAP